MPKHRANGRRWPGMLQSSKDRARAIAVVFIGGSGFLVAGIAAVVGRALGPSRDFVQPQLLRGAQWTEGT